MLYRNDSHVNLFLELNLFSNSTLKYYLVQPISQFKKKWKHGGNYESLPINVLSQLIPPIA